ncbi:MAG TPA: shikimate kinase [Candidatus Nanopelagicales bacterium]|nr:shikimate kinase [Candidatus Nanopelagicales bacterium]
MAPRVVLVGVPGSGKTTVGLLLAERLGIAFRDTDQDVEDAEGRSVPDIFVEDGEAHFRALERAAVARALEEHDGVLALGGGAVLDEGTRALLLDQPTVWLQVGASSGAHRVGLDVPRPVLLGNVRSRLVALLNERAPLYDEVARLRVDTERRTPEEVADTVVAELGLEAHDG